jgi:hypothetical protein
MLPVRELTLSIIVTESVIEAMIAEVTPNMLEVNPGLPSSRMRWTVVQYQVCVAAIGNGERCRSALLVKCALDPTLAI